MHARSFCHSARASTILVPRCLVARQPSACRVRAFSASPLQRDGDPRVRKLGREISDDYATIRDHYAAPKYPVVLAHGLLGFAEFRLIQALPAVQYWRGIKDALRANGTTVIATRVPPSSSIADRAAALAAAIDAAHIPASSPSSASHADPRPAVNIIAHSMGGLDARYMISHLRPKNLRIASLTTVATPHRGSSFADFLLGGDAPLRLSSVYGVLERAGLGTAAFGQLTREYVGSEFNPATPDDPEVRYFSFGAAVTGPLPLLSPFRLSQRVVSEAEGANDGLVSVESSRWGDYRGTLMEVSHLDLINWSNRLRWTVREWMGMKKNFNAVALYLDIADMLAKEGL